MLSAKQILMIIILISQICLEFEELEFRICLGFSPASLLLESNVLRDPAKREY